MNSHLNENQITDALLGIADDSAREHLASCGQCLQKVEAATSLLSGFGKDARREAERTDGFWEHQGLAIMERSSAHLRASNRWSLRLAWGAAAATAAAVVILWATLGNFDSQPPAPPENTVIADSHEHDERLLRQVEAALERGTPVALAPAEVLTRELHRRAKPVTNVKQVSSSNN